MKQKVWEVLIFKKSVNNTMALTMGNLENFMRTKLLDDAFKDIKSFSNSKKLACSMFKRRAVFDMCGFLTQRHYKINRMYFNRYWKKVFDKKQRIKRLKGIFGKINSQLRHDGFRRWVNWANKLIDAEELNETGPITEHVFEANRLFRNLKHFMKLEGYTPEQIKTVCERANDVQYNRIEKAIKRWKISGDPNKRLLIKAFDHLKMAIQIRKMLRYYLTFCNNRVTHVKADVQDAFRKWACGDNLKAIQLDRLPFEDLELRNIRQCQVLVDISDKEQYNDAVIKHLSLQRDELLAHYIRGQKLALSHCHNKLLQGKSKYFSRWKAITKRGN